MFGSCVVQSVRLIGGSSPVAFARTDHSGRPIPRRHPLTLIVFPASSLARALRIDGLCVLARLSSFQRTDEVRQGRPTDVLSGLRPPTAPVLPERPHRMSNAARLGEPSEVTGTTWPCQPKTAAAITISMRLRLRKTLELRTAGSLAGRYLAVRTFSEYLVPIVARQVNRTR